MRKKKTLKEKYKEQQVEINTLKNNFTNSEKSVAVQRETISTWVGSFNRLSEEKNQLFKKSQDLQTQLNELKSYHDRTLNTFNIFITKMRTQ